LTSPRKKKTVSDRINDRISVECQPLISKLIVEKDRKKQLKLQYAIIETTSRVTLDEINRLSDDDFDRYLKEQVKPFAEAYENFQRELLVQRITHGGLTSADLALVVAEQEIAAKTFGRGFSSAMERIFTKRKMLERTVVLLTMSTLQLGLQQQITNANLEPLSVIANMIASHFGADANWLFAVSILATHENLVKKKLLDLGVDETILEKEAYPVLIERLAKEIQDKEQRKLGLGFYKSDSLRTIRNELEHRGYRYKVTREQMLELLKDLKDFEKEVFPTPGSATGKPNNP
jgi:hypothetical protein